MALTREVERELHDLLDAAMKGSHVQHMAKFCQKLKEHNLMYRSRVHCCHVHVHPANRDGVGVHPSEIHTLLSDIGGAGWDWKECRAVAVEVHGNVNVLNFNQNLWQSARGPFEPYRGRHREVCKPVLYPHKPSTAFFSLWHGA